MGQRQYFTNCVNWPSTCVEHFGAPYVTALNRLIEEGVDIPLDRFRSELDPEAYSDLLSMLNYAQPEEEGLHIEDDYHVAFKREPGTGLVYAVHSAIEYVFATPEEIIELQERLCAMISKMHPRHWFWFTPDPCAGLHGCSSGSPKRTARAMLCLVKWPPTWARSS